MMQEKKEQPSTGETGINLGPSPELPEQKKTSTSEEKERTRPHAAARHAKRLTLNFPIAPPLVNIRVEQKLSSSPSVSTGVSTPVLESSPRMMSPGKSIPDASILAASIINGGNGDASTAAHEPTDLLTAIASQERKVLELKEELQKAEAELSSLKKQWVRSERQKKQTEISHHAEAMRPLRPSVDSSLDHHHHPSPRFSEDSVAHTPTTPAEAVPAQVRRSKELERRNSIRNVAKGDALVSANGRRVFAGSKHTRTLSLLSPDMGVVKSPFPMSPGGSDGTKGAEAQQTGTRHPRSATLPSVDRVDASSKTVESSDNKPAEENQWRRSLPPPSSEALLRTGRQMASDLREGLWTFLEDIRQATVGEEGISATRTRTLQPPPPQPHATTKSRSRSRPRNERSVTPVRSRPESNGVAVGRSGSSTSLSKDGASSSATMSSSKKNGNSNSSSSSSFSMTSPAGTDGSFWSEFGVDSPGQKLKPSQTKAAVAMTGNGKSIQHGQRDSVDSNRTADEDDADEEADGWNNWDTPQPDKKPHSHTPSSSQSTVISKTQSPSTQLSSPRTSASFGDRNIDEAERTRTDNNGIPWPALSKFTASQLARTASSLMDEWEKSLTTNSSPSKAEQDDWEAF